jgi:hypothetical protein
LPGEQAAIFGPQLSVRHASDWGVYLVYALRRPLLAFLDSALDGSASMTVPAFKVPL